jgi:hypothetical protein
VQRGGGGNGARPRDDLLNRGASGARRGHGHESVGRA